jgi:hypothetical protein
VASVDFLSPYAERLLDDYIVENSAEAMDNLRAAARRVRRKPSRAIEDRELQRQLREAAEALRKAVLAVQHGRPKRRSRKPLLVVGAAVAVTVVLVAKPELRSRLLRLGGAGEAGTTPTPAQAAAG